VDALRLQSEFSCGDNLTRKGNDYSEIEDLVKEKVTGLVFMGIDNTALHQFFDGKVDKIVDARSMEEAVKASFSMAKEGDTVLLSPCCASFDLFKNYEDRGSQFKTCVRNL
jgi:UDP-N-acetylmuramoylalanine--D-glutamate ligase